MIQFKLRVGVHLVRRCLEAIPTFLPPYSRLPLRGRAHAWRARVARARHARMCTSTHAHAPLPLTHALRLLAPWYFSSLDGLDELRAALLAPGLRHRQELGLVPVDAVALELGLVASDALTVLVVGLHDA